jgi:hypothetical protein
MDFTALSYRELQGHAKQHGIPANKKKEELIRLLTEATTSSPAVPVAGPAPVVVTPVVQEEVVKEEEDVFALQVLDNMIEEEEDVAADEESPVDEVLDQLMEGIEGLKLRGLPTPAGKKTVFEESESDANEYKCNWG